jgi:hypothetical protein
MPDGGNRHQAGTGSLEAEVLACRIFQNDQAG